MTKTKTKKQQLLSSAPWRGEDDSEKFADGKLRATNQPGSTPTMYVPAKKSSKKGLGDDDDDDDQSLGEIDPQLRYSFQRNYQSHIQPVLMLDKARHPQGSAGVS